MWLAFCTACPSLVGRDRGPCHAGVLFSKTASKGALVSFFQAHALCLKVFTAGGLLHAWDAAHCSLFTNALFYSPVRPYRPPSWPGPTSRVHASMRPSRKSDRYVRYVRYATLRALHAAMEATAVHEVGGAPLLAVNMA